MGRAFAGKGIRLRLEKDTKSSERATDETEGYGVRRGANFGFILHG